MAVPIWKDKIVTLAQANYTDFDIIADSTTIYSGRAYLRPGATYTKVKVNNLCADYLAQALPASQGFTSFAVQKSFAVQVAGSTIETIVFYNDWSYDDDFDPATMDLAHPINYLVDPRQYIIFSTLPVQSLTATLTFEDSTTMQVVIPVAFTADFNDDFNADFSQQDVAASGGAAFLDISQYTGLVSVQIGSTIYKVGDGCAKYALYYINAYGGWDSFILDGNEVRKDTIERSTILTDYDNTTIDRGRKDYAIEYTPSWTFRTGYLSNDESGRMHHLLNSNEVYLCELATGTFYPICLTDGEYERKTFRGQMIQYEFNAVFAQERFRR